MEFDEHCFLAAYVVLDPQLMSLDQSSVAKDGNLTITPDLPELLHLPVSKVKA